MTFEHRQPALGAHNGIHTGFSEPAFDVEKQDEFLYDYLDLNKDRKCEFLETIWNIVAIFVDLRFGVEETQMALGSVLIPDSIDKASNRRAGIE